MPNTTNNDTPAPGRQNYVKFYFTPGPLPNTLHSCTKVYSNGNASRLDIVAKSHIHKQDGTQLEDLSDGINVLLKDTVTAVRDITGFGSDASHNSQHDYLKNGNVSSYKIPLSEQKARQIEQFIDATKHNIEQGTLKYAACDQWRQRQHRGNNTFMNCNTATSRVFEIIDNDAKSDLAQQSRDEIFTDGNRLISSLELREDALRKGPTYHQVKNSYPQHMGFFATTGARACENFTHAMDYKMRMATGR